MATAKFESFYKTLRNVKNVKIANADDATEARQTYLTRAKHERIIHSYMCAVAYSKMQNTLTRSRQGYHPNILNSMTEMDMHLRRLSNSTKKIPETTKKRKGPPIQPGAVHYTSTARWR